MDRINDIPTTGCGKTQFVVDELLNNFRHKFDIIVLLCPTYVNNRTWNIKAIDADDNFYVDILDPNALTEHLKFWHNSTKPIKEKKS
jgi:hypothetical protein